VHFIRKYGLYDCRDITAKNGWLDADKSSPSKPLETTQNTLTITSMPNLYILPQFQYRKIDKTFHHGLRSVTA